MILDKQIEKSLPNEVLSTVRKMSTINEIRLRRDKPFCLTIGTKSFGYEYVTNQNDIENCIKSLCKSSVHTYFDFINQGYIPCKNGYRVGVCGKAVLEKNKIINISEITSINIRIPSPDVVIPKEALKSLPYDDGFLVYSPPNVGKTTLLKAVASYVASSPYNKRVCVIDPKNELYSHRMHHAMPIDFFSGYPKFEAIEMAIKNMSPEIIICDEIGLNDDIDALIECKNSGVSLICSAHASTLSGLLNRKNVQKMHNSRIFGGYLGIDMTNGVRKYVYTPTEEIQ